MDKKFIELLHLNLKTIMRKLFQVIKHFLKVGLRKRQDVFFGN